MTKNNNPSSTLSYPLPHKLICFALILLLLSWADCRAPHRSQTQPQQPRSILSNEIAKDQQIGIKIRVFNSTNHIFQTSYETVYSSDLLQFVLPVRVEIFQSMDNITIETIFTYRDLDSGLEVQVWRGAANLTKFKKISKLNSQQFFEASSSPNHQKGNHTLHIAQDFNIMIIYSNMKLPGQEAHLMKKINFTTTQFLFNGNLFEAKYKPRLDISQMHVPYKYYQPITGLLKENLHQNSTLNDLDYPSIKNHTVNLHIYPYDLMKYAVFYQMFDPSQRQQATKANPLMQYMMDDEALDDMKQLLFTNNLYIVGITMLMTLVKTVLEIFALKNELKVWNQIEKNKGLSIKILYTDLVFQVVFFLYLVENESNLMMTLPMGFGILMVLWKIKKTICIQKGSSFPFIRLSHYDWCKDHQKIDNEGVKYMYYGLAVLFAGYMSYQLITSESLLQIFTYSGILQKLVFFMGMAGFIRMTPQLYINYKLKSVDHLPWRTLIYRFIQTIIDDFYVFLVTTPLLHKVMVFREDIIFLLYLYQRMIYKIDPNRIGTAGGVVLEKQQIQQIRREVEGSKAIKNQ